MLLDFFKKKVYGNFREKNMIKHVCDLCGYVYDPAEGDPSSGAKPGTAFDALPADWVCPMCGVSKDNFYTVET